MTRTIKLRNPERIQLLATYGSLYRTPRGEEARMRIMSDGRFKAIDKGQVLDGNGWSQLDIASVTMWLLWSEDNFGKALTDQYLEDFLNNSPAEMLVSVWILGVDADKIYTLSDNFHLTPLKFMPPSETKDNYQTIFLDEPSTRTNPGAAITQPVLVRRILGLTQDTRQGNPTLLHLQAHEDFETLASIANLLPGVCCLPYHNATYLVDPHIPCGPFKGYFSGIRHHDIIPRKSVTINPVQIEQWSRLFGLTRKLTPKNKLRLAHILNRLARSKCSSKIDDRILDLSIACEMTLLEGKSLEQLSLSFRTRGAWLLAGTIEDRMKHLTSLKKLYELRSQVAHSGVLGEKGRETAQQNIDEFERIACRIIITCLERHLEPMDWDRCILGGD